MTRYYVHYGESYDASFTTPEEARKEALRALDGWRDDARANDGWADEAASVAWGEVREIATLIPHAGAVEEDGLDDRGVDYELRAPDEDMVRAALTTPEAYVGAMNDAVVEELERLRADLAALRGEHDTIPRHVRIALATATRAFDNRDLRPFGTFNEDLQPMVDAASAWITALRRDLIDAQAEVKSARDELSVVRIEHEAVCGLLTEARRERDELRTLLQRVIDIERIDAHRAGYTGCKCMARSRAAEQAYEMGRCPHQLAAAALAGGKS